MALTAQTINAETALSYGLVTEVVSAPAEKGREQVLEKASKLAQKIARKSGLAAEGTKRVMVWGMGKPVPEGLEYVIAHNGAVLYSKDLQVSSSVLREVLRQLWL